MSPITTHVLDTSRGRPASNLPIALSQAIDGNWKALANGHTNQDGRITDLLEADTVLPSGSYRMRFDTQTYFDGHQEPSFYPYVEIVFNINQEDENQHYHIPLLLSAYGYSTYRGS